MTPIPVNIFPNIDEHKVSNNIPKNPPSCFLFNALMFQ